MLSFWKSGNARSDNCRGKTMSMPVSSRRWLELKTGLPRPSGRKKTFDWPLSLRQGRSFTWIPHAISTLRSNAAPPHLIGLVSIYFLVLPLSFSLFPLFSFFLYLPLYLFSTPLYLFWDQLYEIPTSRLTGPTEFCLWMGLRRRSQNDGPSGSLFM